MQHVFEITAPCPKRCGAEHIDVYCWCMCPVAELRCPVCNAVKEIDGEKALKLVDKEHQRSNRQV
jgi:hypothetical protein